jgi:hypothetical protein
MERDLMEIYVVALREFSWMYRFAQISRWVKFKPSTPNCPQDIFIFMHDLQQ